MLVEVTLLRKHGLRLLEDELAPAVRGELSVTFQGTNPDDRRPLRVAMLRGVQGVAQHRIDLLLPLFDPRIVSITDRRITLTGIELNSEAGRVSEFVQVWQCRLVGG